MREAMEAAIEALAMVNAIELALSALADKETPMHHFESSDGTYFNFNSDLSGSVLISGNHFPVSGSALMEFVQYYQSEYQSDQSARKLRHFDAIIEAARQQHRFIGSLLTWASSDPSINAFELIQSGETALSAYDADKD